MPLTSAVRRIFTNERLGSGGYSQSQSLSDRYGNHRVDSRGPLRPFENTAMLEGYFDDVNLLGPFEQYLLSELTPPVSNTGIALIGGRGSGKTATAGFLAQYVKDKSKSKEPRRRPLVVYIDCNSIGGDELSNFEELLKYICLQTAEKIATLIFSDYWPEMRDYCRDIYDKKVSATQPSLARFHRVLRARCSGVEAKQIDEDEVQECVFKILSDATPRASLTFAMDLVIALWERQSQKFCYFCIDNLDPFPPILQNQILQALLTAVNTSRMPFVVPMRVITSANNHDIGAKVFKKIGQCGISPLREVRRRAEFMFLEMWGGRVDFLAKLSDKNKAFLLLRTSEIYHLFEMNLVFKQFFQSVCGFSLSRGMSFMCRAYSCHEPPLDILGYLKDEDVVEILERASVGKGFDETLRDLYGISEKIYQRERALAPRYYHFLLTMMDQCSRQTHDLPPIMENLFDDPIYGGFSTIKFRILVWLRAITRGKTRPAKIRQIVEKALVAGYEPAQICEALDSLHAAERRLVWCTGRNKFEAFELLQCHMNEQIGITRTGEFYLNKLSGNIDYLSFCLAKTPEEKRTLIWPSLTIRVCFALRLIYEAMRTEALAAIRAERMANPYEIPADRSGKPIRSFVFATLAVQAVAEGIYFLSEHKKNLESSLDADASQKSENRLLEFDEQVGELYNRHLGYEAIFSKEGTLAPRAIRLLDWKPLRLASPGIKNGI